MSLTEKEQRVLRARYDEMCATREALLKMKASPFIKLNLNTITVPGASPTAKVQISAYGVQLVQQALIDTMPEIIASVLTRVEKDIQATGVHLYTGLPLSTSPTPKQAPLASGIEPDIEAFTCAEEEPDTGSEKFPFWFRFATALRLLFKGY